MDFRRTNFGFFRDLLGGILWDTVLKRECVLRGAG